MLGSSHYEKFIYINFHVCTWNKELTCHVTCVVTDISYFHLSKQSRPQSGSSYKRCLIWVKIVTEYDQEIPQSQTADNPMAPRGRATQQSRDTTRTN